MLCINRKVSLVLLAVLAFFSSTPFNIPRKSLPFRGFCWWCSDHVAALFVRPGDLGKIKVTAFLTRPKLITAAFMVVYVAVFPWLGFFVTTFLTVFGYILVFEPIGPAKGVSRRTGLGGAAVSWRSRRFCTSGSPKDC